MSRSLPLLGTGPTGAGTVGLYIEATEIAAAPPPPPPPPPSLSDDVIGYPDDLPGPVSLAWTPDERRRMTGRPGPWQVRAYGREVVGTVQTSWVLSPAEASAWFLWWSEDLADGGAWFAADWPNPAGAELTGYAFMEPPKWEHQGRGIWRVSAPLEYRPQVAT